MRTLHRAGALTLFAVIVAAYGVGVYFGWETRSHPDNGGWGIGGLASSLGFALTTFLFPLVGVLIATRRPGNLIAWLLLGIGLAWGLEKAASTYAVYGLDMHRGSRQLALDAAAIDGFLWLPAIGLMGSHLLLCFPDGRLVSRGWRWVAWTAGIAIVLGSAAIVLDPGPMTDSSFPTAVNPFGWDAAGGVLDWLVVVIAVLPVAIVCSAAGLVVRYRRTAGAERLQLKWLVAAAAVVAGIYGVVETVSIFAGGTSVSAPGWLRGMQDVALFSFGLVPISIGVAVFRYHLYDIDVIIRRTVTYTCVAAVVLAVYLGSVAGVSTALQSVAGRSGALATTVSTLLAALVARPVHGRIRRAVDRRFSRAAYDAARALESFEGRLREQFDIDALSGELLTLVTQTVHPAHATVWLRPTGEQAASPARR